MEPKPGGKLSEIKTPLTSLAIFLPGQQKSDYIGALLANLYKFRPIWTISDKFEQFQTSLDKFSHRVGPDSIQQCSEFWMKNDAHLTSLDKPIPIWTSLNNFGQVWTIPDKFGQV